MVGQQCLGTALSESIEIPEARFKLGKRLRHRTLANVGRWIREWRGMEKR
jgi:hypothetical protein